MLDRLGGGFIVLGFFCLFGLAVSGLILKDDPACIGFFLGMVGCFVAAAILTIVNA